ncbi:MAG: MBL fold metallo-hydrolase [Spirochaetales bacterium]|jgi:glyoxylase-like metal-dependent hydrolase (beta-lactamase superfamily II)
MLKRIISTHSNADHIGGNDYLQRMTGCPRYASRAEKAFIESPEIEKNFLWAAFPRATWTTNSSRPSTPW